MFQVVRRPAVGYTDIRALDSQFKIKEPSSSDLPNTAGKKNPIQLALPYKPV
jgi:hypothetical protein